MVAVGIDLGTTSCCVAVWRDGGVEVIPNEQGNRTTPSCVAFTASERLVGETAKNQASVNVANTIYGAKRLIGRRCDEVGLQMDLRRFPYAVINENGKPKIVVNYRGEKCCFAPEEICAMMVFRMKEVAEGWLGCNVDRAVVTVPAYFNDSQRQATRLAGRIAGLDVTRILNEPTAAALAYGFNKNFDGDKNVLVYDLGGGTLDVTVLTIAGGVYEVKATAGNPRLGGDDFDDRLVAYLVEDFRKRYNKEVESARSMRGLKLAAETAKMALTSCNQAVVNIESLCETNYVGRVTRGLFEQLCSDLFKDTIKPIDQALMDAGICKEDVHEVILVGGSTRMPMIRKLLKDYFGADKISTSINPEEAIACGAAIQAAILTGEANEKIRDLLLVDVVPLSLGVETARGMMYKVVDRNTPVPCRVVKEITTLEDYQTAMTIEIFEGERTLTKDNHCLGAFELRKIPPAPRGVAKIDVIFDVDSNGVLTVSAVDSSTGNSNSITIGDFRLPQQEISSMMSKALRFREEDDENRRRLEARNQLETYIYSVRRSVVENPDNLSGYESGNMFGQCQDALAWLDDNPDCLREEYDRKMSELLLKWSFDVRKLDDHRAKRYRGDSYCENASAKTVPKKVSDENT